MFLFLINFVFINIQFVNINLLISKLPSYLATINTKLNKNNNIIESIIINYTSLSILNQFLRYLNTFIIMKNVTFKFLKFTNFTCQYKSILCIKT